jgi:hypothetical protein
MLLTVGLGCSRRSPAFEQGPAPAPVPSGPIPLAQLYVLEMSGVPPSDTTATFSTAEPRTVILRHGQPDNTVFAELSFPAGTFAGAGVPESVTVSVHPRPGVYGIDLTSTVPVGRAARLVFKYPIHFSAPVSGQQRYGGTVQFERALSIAHLTGAGTWTLIPSSRPAPDNLAAPLQGTGTYLVVAPK